MGGLIFRIDDVSPNTNLFELQSIHSIIREIYPLAEIWNAISMLGGISDDGAIYPGAPFKDREIKFFYNVNTMMELPYMTGKPVSHGLIHCDHSKLQYDAQEMSILTSCNYIGANTFVPPFNRYNEATEAVCRQNNINLVKIEDGWRNLDHCDFDDSHKLWYFHPWRYTPQTFKEKIGAMKRV